MANQTILHCFIILVNSTSLMLLYVTMTSSTLLALFYNHVDVNNSTVVISVTVENLTIMVLFYNDVNCNFKCSDCIRNHRKYKQSSTVTTTWPMRPSDVVL